MYYCMYSKITSLVVLIITVYITAYYDIRRIMGPQRTSTKLLATQVSWSVLIRKNASDSQGEPAMPCQPRQHQGKQSASATAESCRCWNQRDELKDGAVALLKMMKDVVTGSRLEKHADFSDQSLSH